MEKSVALLLLFLAAVSGQTATSRVTIKDNGYTNIVVAFHNDIKESEGEPLIQKIKELFSSASYALYRATRQRSYFKEVTILVPKTWAKKPEYKVASYEVFTEADVKIEAENPLHGDGPYTLQPLPCEQPARYIHLTPNYLKHLNSTSTELFGDPAKTLVHEWAHYRYGIFDEYAESSNFPAFYIDRKTEEVLPNACTNYPLVGEEWNSVEERSCSRQKNGLPEDDCVFLPDPFQNDKVTSSIASYHFLPNAYTFCDDSDEFKHNEHAPNMHNRMCNSRSTWTVITKHKDFAKDNNPPKDIASTVPTFKIVQQEEATFCLVLDISTSMNDPANYPKITMLNEAASRWIKEEVKYGSNVGVVLFGHGARLAHSIIPVKDETDKQKLINAIPKTAGGMTCIGCGLNTAAAELKRFRNGEPGGIIVLLSDGGENEAPMIKDVQQSIINAKIRVITMAFTAAASPNMEALAIATKGKQFSIPLDQSVGKLETSFHEIGTYQTTDDDLAAKVSEKRFQGNSGPYEGTFSIDNTIGRETTVSFLYKNRNDITDIIISGSSLTTSISSPSADSKFDDIRNLKQLKFFFKDLKTDTYSYKVIRNGAADQDVTVSVMSKSRKKGQEAIRTTCRIQEVMNSNPIQYLITAEVRKGNKPVIKAKVISKVDLPNGGSVYVELFDTGKKGDIYRDDGIYSGYFTKYAGKGRYAVSASVVSNSMTAWLETGYVASSKALAILNKQSKPANVTQVTTGTFERVADAGSFQIEQDINAQNVDLFPPSRVTDLTVLEIAKDYSYVVLEWSAPGDDLQDGFAQEYEMRYTMDWRQLNSKFFGQTYNITTPPKEAGETESLQAKLRGFGPGVTYFVALKAKDDTNKWSELSNIAEVRGV